MNESTPTPLDPTMVAWGWVMVTVGANNRFSMGGAGAAKTKVKRHTARARCTGGITDFISGQIDLQVMDMKKRLGTSRTYIISQYRNDSYIFASFVILASIVQVQ